MNKARDMAYIALMVAVIVVCAWIAVPTVVPFTLQTFAVFATLLLLGGKRGAFAIAVYLLLGAAGVPVFSAFRGGIGALLGATGGYLFGFLFTAFIYWLFEALFEWRADSGIKRVAWQCAALIIGLIACYAAGTAWFMYAYASGGKAITLAAALSSCVLPFVLPDLAKLAVAVVVSRRVEAFMWKKGK